jgi:hypothetical protein
VLLAGRGAKAVGIVPLMKAECSRVAFQMPAQHARVALAGGSGSDR